MSEIRHIKKLFGGKKTNIEVFREVAWAGKSCTICKSPPVIRIKSYVLVDALRKKNPDLLARMAAVCDPPGQLPILPTIHGNAIKVGDVFACKVCRQSAERAAAKHGSDYFVEIDRGPDPVNPIVQVPR